MLTFTVPLANRDTMRPRFTVDEAFELADKGFRFSIFRPATEEFQLSLPYRVAEDRDHGTLTLMQDELR